MISFVDKQGTVYRDWPAKPALASLRVLLTSTTWDPMVDTTHSSVSRVLGTSIRKVAGYDTGSSDIAWTAADWKLFDSRWATVHIDQSQSTRARGKVKDVEPGASTIAEAVAWAKSQRIAHQPVTIYLAEFIPGYSLVECRSAMTAAGITNVTYWVANWGLTQAQAILRLGKDVVAWQWASPSSNGSARLPGTSLTLSQANADLSVTLKSWFPIPSAKASGTFNSKTAFAVDKTGSGGSWDVKAAPGDVTFGAQEVWYCAEIAVCGGGKRKGQWIHVARPLNHITPDKL